MAKQLLAALGELTQELSMNKTAAANGQVKRAEPTPSDPGGYQGGSDHPTASADNNVQAATEGPRSSENASDVKDAIDSPAVDNATAPAPDADLQSDVQYNVGTTQAPTGEDASVEDDYKGDKDDPGTTHPAKTEDSVKYGGLSIKKAHALCATLGNDILATLAVGAPIDGVAQQKTAAAPAQPVAGQQKQATDAKPAEDAAAAAAAGYELAAMFGIEKDAAGPMAEDTLLRLMQDADQQADLVAGYLKAAEDADGQNEGEHDDAGSGESDGGGEAGGGGAMPPDPIVSGDAGGGAPPAAPGMDPGMDPAMDPAAGAGGAGGGGAEQVLQELVAALMELGITPDQLAAAAQQASAGAAPPPDMGGGAPPDMGGGAPPPDMMGGAAAPPTDMAGLMAGAKAAGVNKKVEAATLALEIAKSAQALQRSGRFELKAAGSKQALAQRQYFKDHVRELVNTLVG